MLCFFRRIIRIVDQCFYKYCMIQYGSAMAYTILGGSLIVEAKGQLPMVYMMGFGGAFLLGTYCYLGMLVETSVGTTFICVNLKVIFNLVNTEYVSGYIHL